MPADDSRRSHHDQRVLPTRPQLSRRDPEQLVETAESRASSLGTDSQQLLSKSQVLQKKFFSGAKAGDDPAKQISKAHKHQGIIAKSALQRRASNSLILQACKVLAKHTFALLADCRNPGSSATLATIHPCRRHSVAPALPTST